MTSRPRLGFKGRLMILIVASVVVTAWNVALSSRRRHMKGEIVSVLKQDLVISVRCPSKIEPRVQQTLRSIVKGKKKSVLVREGDAVTEGQLLMEITEDDVRKEENTRRIQFENASSDALKAYKDLQLIKTLFSKGAASSREVDDAQRTLVRANQLRDSTEQELAEVREKAKGTRVLSPMSGTILKIDIEREEDISEREELLTVAKLNDFVVRGRVDELEIAEVRVGQEAVVTCDAFRDVEMPGVVEWIGPQAREGAFSEVEVLISITDMKGLKLKSNLSGLARITVEKMLNVIVVPADAVLRDPEGPYVLKENRGGWLKEQHIQIGRMTDEFAVIENGLSPGDRVLLVKGK